LENSAKNAPFSGMALQRGPSLGLHPFSFSLHPFLPGPFSRHPFKEQARERRTPSTLPRFSGTATFIFLSEFTADHAKYTELEREDFPPTIFRRFRHPAVFTPPCGTLFGRVLPRISLISRMENDTF